MRVTLGTQHRRLWRERSAEGSGPRASRYTSRSARSPAGPSATPRGGRVGRGRPRGPSRSGEQPAPHLLRRALLQHILLHGHGPRGGLACCALPGPGQRRGRPGRTAPPPAGREGGDGGAGGGCGGRTRAPRAGGGGERLPESATAAASGPPRPPPQRRSSAAAQPMGAGEGERERASGAASRVRTRRLRRTAPVHHCGPVASGRRERPAGMALSSSRRDSASRPAPAAVTAPAPPSGHAPARSRPTRPSPTL